ncbi:MAG: MogA/MoaB family molybdenum cofactor biosynthesis protein [Desulfobacterota bacterium]|jgi:molybdenum cofactor synthesis domain-containing protein|nr:MogA/MoaB family molybdenum cofactor biosynthesis protein [Thermodesulfobacteriota bacterium]
MFKVGILTISDKASRGLREDLGGPRLRALLGDHGFRVELSAVVPDEIPEIVDRLVDWIDVQRLDLVLTTGGTGVSPRDVTPEATAQVLEKEIPGMAEAMRAEGLKHTPHAQISRARAGLRGRALIVNLPGSLKAIEELLPVILPALPHALNKLQGDPADCGR